MNIKIAILACIFLFAVQFSNAVQAQGYTIQATNGQVTAMALNTTTSTLYIGGLFTHVNVSVTGSFVPINESDGFPEQGWPLVIGDVNAIVPDGNGGWFIAGTFGQVGGVPRLRIAQINAAKQVTSWNPGANFEIKALLLVGNTLYVSGGFTNISGVARIGFAALDATTGIATNFNSSTAYYGGEITTMALSGNTLFVGGRNITTIMGVARKNLASIDLTTGSVTGWNPDPNTDVYTLVVNNNTLYVGGLFSFIAGKTQEYIASFEISTGSITGWDPDPSRAVTAIAIAGNTAYLGGAFTGVRNQIRWSGLAAVNTTGVGFGLTSWTPSSFLQFASGGVETIAVNNNAVYVGGRFKSFQGVARNGLAAFDLNSGTLLGWNPNTNKARVDNDRFIWIHAIALAGGRVYTGGDFETVGGAPRKFIAALDATTGNETNWNPNANDYIESFALSGNTVYAGGFFTTIGGINRNYIAAIDATTGSVTGWNPNANFAVKSINVKDNEVYIGGQFTTIAGANRNRLAAVDATTGLITAFNPNVSGEIRTSKIIGNTMYIGGEFATVGGILRRNLAAIDIPSGAINSWQANTSASSSRVNAINVSGNTVYVAGRFTTVSGVRRNRLAALDATTGTATPWNPDVDNEVNDILIKDGLVYAVGGFNKIGAVIRHYIATVDASSGALTDWNPNVSLNNSFGATNIVADASYLYLAGSSAYLLSDNTFPGTWLGKNSQHIIRTLESDPANAILVSAATLSGLGGVSAISTNGGTLQMISTFAPANATNTNVLWSATTPASVATISSSGLLTAIGNGSVTVTGVYGSVSAFKIITISGQVSIIPIISATVSGLGKMGTVGVGNALQLVYAYSPSNANVNITPTWSLSHPSIASINSITGVVSGIIEGMVTVTGTFGGITASTVITVIPAVAVSGVSVSPTSLTMVQQNEVQLTAIISPAAATNINLTWSSDNASVAGVNSTGLVSGLNKGTATVTVSTQDGGFTASSLITVSGITLGIMEDNQSESLRFYPNPASQLVKLSVSSWSYLQINDVTGWSVTEKVTVTDSSLDVKSLAPGLYFIRVFSKSGKMLSGKLQVGL